MYLKIESHQLKTTLKAIEKVEFLIHLRNHCQDIFNFLKNYTIIEVVPYVKI